MLADLLGEILGELRGIRAALEQRPGGCAPQVDARHVRVIEALAAIVTDADLPFSTAEVIEHARVDHGLDEALTAAGAMDAGRLGLVFRGLRDLDVDGYRLTRDGRQWRLLRTSCT
jgi:hypothetical protein